MLVRKTVSQKKKKKIEEEEEEGKHTLSKYSIISLTKKTKKKTWCTTQRTV